MNELREKLIKRVQEEIVDLKNKLSEREEILLDLYKPSILSDPNQPRGLFDEFGEIKTRNHRKDRINKILSLPEGFPMIKEKPDNLATQKLIIELEQEGKLE